MHNCTSIVSMLSPVWERQPGLATALLFLLSLNAIAQIEDPVTWDFGLYPSEQGPTTLLSTPRWTRVSIYSQDNNPDDGPVPTEFGFEWPAG